MRYNGGTPRTRSENPFFSDKTAFKLSDFIDFQNSTNDDDYDLFWTFEYHVEDIKDMKEKLKSFAEIPIRFIGEFDIHCTGNDEVERKEHFKDTSLSELKTKLLQPPYKAMRIDTNVEDVQKMISDEEVLM